MYNGEEISISYGRTAYVKTDKFILDEISQSINHEGDGEVLSIDEEVITEFLDDTRGVDPGLVRFLKAVMDKVEDDAGTIVFHP